MHNNQEFNFRDESKKLFTCNFSIEKSNSKGFENTVIISFRLGIGSERSNYVATKLSIQRNQWDNEKKRIIGKSSIVKDRNKYLDNIEEQSHSIYQKLKETNVKINPNQIKDIMLGRIKE